MLSQEKPAVRHHYVPEFLLKRFCAGKKPQLWAFDKHTRRSFRTNVKNIACETHFNDFELEGHEVTVEPSLAQLESRVAPICKRIVRKEALSELSLESRALLSYFVAVQMVRTPQQRNTIRDFHVYLQGWLDERGADIRTIEGCVEPTENELKKQGLLALKSAKELSVYVLDKAWILWRAPKSDPFYISDHPIALQNLIDRPGRGNLGLAVEGIEVYLPLSSRFCLAMVCPSYYEKIVGGYHRHASISSGTDETMKSVLESTKSIVDGFEEGVAVDANGPAIENMNSLQVIGSARYVFSEKNDFRLVESMLDEAPEVAKGRRMIVS